MPKRVKLPNGEIGVFPDSMNDEAIQGVLQKQFPVQPPGPQLPVPHGLQGPPSVPMGSMVKAAASFLPSAVHATLPKPVQQFGQQAGRDLSKIVPGVKSAVGSAMEPVTPTPPKPLFNQLADVGKAVGGAIAQPFEMLGTSDTNIGGFNLPNADLATMDLLGGNSTKYKEFLDKGNFGAATWEGYGKPLALMAAGELMGGGKALTEGATGEQANMVKNVMSKGSRDEAGNLVLQGPEITGAREALQDAARDLYGTGPKGFKKLKKAAPTGSIMDSIKNAKRGDVFSVDQGNENLLKLTNHAVDLAGEPADQVNTALGYMDGHEAAKNIAAKLKQMAGEIESNGDAEYANQLRKRAGEIEGKKTLGEIYEIKKTANRLGDMPKNVKESYDLLDSRAAQARAIRDEVYPRYQEAVQSSMMPGFNMSDLGRKEGAAIKFRNGWWKMSSDARVATSETHMPGHIGKMAARGTSEGRMKISLIERGLEHAGIMPSDAGRVNLAGREIIGKLSPDTVPEQINTSGVHEHGGEVQYTPRQAGTLPPGHPLSKGLPAAISDVNREYEQEQ